MTLTTLLRTSICWLLLMGVTLCAARPAQAQQSPTLAELAKREQARRKTTGVKAPPKVFTNKDLPASATKPALPPAVPAGAAAPATEPVPDPQKPPEEQKDEAWWRARITGVREELRRNEMFVEALQTRVNALSADFVNRDDPYQRGKIGEDRQKALAEMARVNGDIQKLKQQIADIEEEARTAGVPPGWLR